MNYKQLAKLFTSSNINKVAKGDLSLIYAIVAEHSFLECFDSLGAIHEEVYKILCKNYPNEYVIKNMIANNILLGVHSMNTATMLSEVRVGANKADCVIINGMSTCYEIKTKYDSLSRLSEQLASYAVAFDKIYVVTHEIHLDSILKFHEKNPTFGVIVSNERNNLSKKIIAPVNDMFDSELMFHTLRRDEYKDVYENVIGCEPNFPTTDLFTECKKVFCDLEFKDANAQFKRVLKKYRKNDDEFINELPRSMKNIGVSYKINRGDKKNILSSIFKSNLLDMERQNVLPVYERKTV